MRPITHLIYVLLKHIHKPFFTYFIETFLGRENQVLEFEHFGRIQIMPIKKAKSILTLL